LNKITVVTYLHENERQFNRCIEGMESQTYQDFEWIIVTHAPVTEKITCNHEVYIIPSTIGTKSGVLNHILPQIHTPYIAYNDSDDRSYPARLETQLKFMEANPNIYICSAKFTVNETDFSWPMHENNDMICGYLPINSPMANPAIMLKNEPGLWGNKIKYNTDYIRAQDYDFWFQCCEANLQFYNIQEALLSYYVAETPSSNDQQKQFASNIRSQITKRIGITLTKEGQNTLDGFASLNLVDPKQLSLLLRQFYKHDFPKAYKKCLSALAWQLELYLKHHQITEESQLYSWLNKLQKPSIFRKLYR